MPHTSDISAILDIPKGVRWLYLDLNSYFASVEQQMQPHLRGRPVAVVPMAGTDSTCAIAASYEAKAYGIKTGTMIYEAKKICPSLQIVPARHDRYVDYHHRIMEEIEHHIPLDKVCSIDEVACRLTGPQCEVDVAFALARRIKKGIHDNVGKYLRSSIGIAPNRFLSKVASNLQKPDGLTILEGEDLPERLRHLKLRDLPGIGHNMERRLSAAGITDLISFWNIAPKHARSIWGGVQGERFWYALHGVEVGEPPENDRHTVGHSHVLAPEMRPPEKARIIARRLTTKAVSRMRRIEYRAEVFNLYVRYPNVRYPKNSPKRGWNQMIKIPPAQDNFSFLRALNILWDQMIRDDSPRQIKQISISLYGLTKESDIMPDMFAGLDDPVERQQQKYSRLSRAMDAVNQKWGLDTIMLGSLPAPASRFSGTKIAFTRIPEKAEFKE